MKIKTLQFSKTRSMQWVKIGAVNCKRYEGTDFIGKAIQSKADTGLWYTSVEGSPFAVEGEGATPESAIYDAIIRNIAMEKSIGRAVATLTAAQETVKTGSEH